jgi:protein-tyrosine phosphatase
MVDIHSHILWGLDDGAKTLEDSVAMVRMAAQAGTTDIVATPHANNQYVYDPELIHARAEELRHAAGENPRIHVGSDFHLSFENIEHALRDPRRYTVNRLRYLMVELPETLIPPHLGRAFEQMRQVGIIPVITHPERNRVLWQDKRLFEDWIEAGCYAQITAQSLDGTFGRTAREVAWRLLDGGKAHFVASDAHDTQHRPPRLDEAFSLVARKYGKETADRLFRRNPRRVIEGAALAETGEPKKGKPRFRLFH